MFPLFKTFCYNLDMDLDLQKIIDQIKDSDDYFEKAKLLEFLVREKQVPVKDLGRYLSLKPSHVCHILRLNRLPEMIIDGYYSKLVTISHLFILSRVKDKEKVLEIYEKILGQGLTVLQTEYLVRDALYGIETDGNRVSQEDFKNLSSLITDGIKKADVKLVQSRIKTKLIIEIKGSLKQGGEFLRNFSGRIKKQA